MNITEPVTFECIATGIPPPTIQWFRGDIFLTPEETSGSGQNLLSNDELNLRFMLSEPSEMLVPTPSGNIYQVERTLTFNTNGGDTGLYTCMASNINEVQPNVTQAFELSVLGRSGDVKQTLYLEVDHFVIHTHFIC